MTTVNVIFRPDATGSRSADRGDRPALAEAIRQRFRPDGANPPGSMHAAAKRGLDLFGVGLALILLGPIMLASMAWVRWIDGGPVLYSQWRVGRDGWLFRIHKLRTMRRDAENGEARFATSDDDRVLPGCRWMRRSHIDELPQLLNILAGEMSFVGPRPERPEVIEELREHLPAIETRLAVKPGLTGLAQVRNGYTNTVEGLRRKTEFDLDYIRRPSVWTDLRLIMGTFPKFWDRTAC